MILRWVVFWLVGYAFFLPVVVSADETGEREMAARIDDLLKDRWEREKVLPAPTANDAEFLRRAWLDLCGVIPPLNHADGISGIRDFLESSRPDKHSLLIDALLNKPRHAAHFAVVWKNVMLHPDATAQRVGQDSGFEAWLRGQFAENRAYHELVSDVLLAKGTANQVGPAVFYTALELKPEELAASTSRIFLGTQIECAQCHDHPFDHWTREDFWGYAAFFARIQRPPGSQAAFLVQEAASGELKIPDTEENIPPTFLGGMVSPDTPKHTRRERLAEWMTSPKNPYFARATVNRVWALMFGRGLVEPVDDLGPHNPASHPELLNELSAYFVESGYDLRQLLRTLARTKAYQLSSESSSPAHPRPELFATMAIKSLSAEELYDCLSEAIRRREPISDIPSVDPNRQAFLTKFQAPTQGATEYEAGIPQALTLMNGQFIRHATDLRESDLLVALNAPFFTNEKRVEVLFLSTLSRFPTEEERAQFVEYVNQGGTRGNSRQALGDVLWALLNSAEFVFNH